MSNIQLSVFYVPTLLISLLMLSLITLIKPMKADILTLQLQRWPQSTVISSMDSIARHWRCALYSHHLLAFVHENSDSNPFGCLPNILLRGQGHLCICILYVHVQTYMSVYVCLCINVCLCFHVCTCEWVYMFYVHAFVFMRG